MNVAVFTMGAADTKHSKSFTDIGQSKAGVSTVLCEATNPWPDCLKPKFSHLPLVFSERVVSLLESESIRGLKLTPAIAISASRSKREERPYFIVEPTAPPPDVRFRVYERTSGDQLKFVLECKDRAKDPHYLRYLETGPFPPRIQRVCNQDSFDSDFMRIPETESGTLGFGVMFCTRRVVELARREQWTNFCFTPIDSMGNMFADSREYPWPPELWYPAWQPKGPD